MLLVEKRAFIDDPELEGFEVVKGEFEEPTGFGEVDPVGAEGEISVAHAAEVDSCRPCERESSAFHEVDLDVADSTCADEEIGFFGSSAANEPNDPNCRLPRSVASTEASHLPIFKKLPLAVDDDESATSALVIAIADTIASTGKVPSLGRVVDVGSEEGGLTACICCDKGTDKPAPVSSASC